MARKSGAGDGGSGGVDRSGKGNSPKRQQDVLWQEVLSLATYVETAFKTAVEALCQGRLDLVERVKAEEQEIDRWEVRIETECLRLLALYGLVASDLRRIVAALRVNRELEGLADIAENLAKRARKLVREPAAGPFMARLGSLADESFAVVDRSLVALANLDADLAREVVLAENHVEIRRAEILADLKGAVRSDPERIDTWLRLIASARNLHRAGEHAVNIAESVVYMREGVFLRHGQENPGDD